MIGRYRTIVNRRLKTKDRYGERTFASKINLITVGQSIPLPLGELCQYSSIESSSGELCFSYPITSFHSSHTNYFVDHEA